MKPRKRTPVRERFLRLVAVDEATGCWLWTGAVSKKGYAFFTADYDKGSREAHRIAYELFVGPIPEGLTIDHLCRVRHCVNPAHMEPVTHRENCLRGESPCAVNARKTHCLRGHPYDEENTYWSPEGWRYCRACNRLKLQRRRVAVLSARAPRPCASPVCDNEIPADARPNRMTCSSRCRHRLKWENQKAARVAA